MRVWRIGSVPLYNMMAVAVLSFFQPEQRKRDKLLWKKTLKGIVTNPIIIGIAAGLFWSALRIPMPYVIEKTVSNIGAVATPLGLMALGASFDVQKALGKIKPVIAACMLKLVSAFCGDARISQRRIDRDSRHAWIGDNSKLLCYGKKYGT